MDFRTKRQLIVIALILLVMAIPAAYFVYLYAPKPTCEDNRKNQGEERVDCGGPCIPCALKHPQNLNVFWVRYVQIRENSYDVVAEIRNPNLKLGVQEFEYEFRLFDDAGVRVASRSGKSFIFPNETIHLFEANMQTLRTLKRAEVVAKSVGWVYTDAIPPDVAVGDKQFQVFPVKQESSLLAKLVNRSLSDFSEVVLTALIFDPVGNILAASKIIEKHVRSGDVRDVFFSWPRELPELNITIIIEPRVNTLKPLPL